VGPSGAPSLKFYDESTSEFITSNLSLKIHAVSQVPKNAPKQSNESKRPRAALYRNFILEILKLHSHTPYQKHIFGP